MDSKLMRFFFANWLNEVKSVHVCKQELTRKEGCQIVSCLAVLRNG